MLAGGDCVELGIHRLEICIFVEVALGVIEQSLCASF